MSEWNQSLTLTQNVDWRFLLHTTLPNGGVVTHPHYIQMSSQGVMSRKKASNTLFFWGTPAPMSTSEIACLF